MIIEPNMPASAYQTFAYARGRDTARKATCQQVGCQAFARGWESTFDESTDLGRSQAHYVRTGSGRAFKESRTGAGLTVFRFEPYQRCFADHKTVAESFSVYGGDRRQNRGVIRRHANGADWAEDFSEHQDKLNTILERG
jgi:hypothetical protein